MISNTWACMDLLMIFTRFVGLKRVKGSGHTYLPTMALCQCIQMNSCCTVVYKKIPLWRRQWLCFLPSELVTGPVNTVCYITFQPIAPHVV